MPHYHNQFIAISGIVEFRSDRPENLPTTTTKRGIDASSRLYLQVKQRMREGIKLFTDYTNRWKMDIQKSKEHMKEGKRLDFGEIKELAKSDSSVVFRTARKGIGGKFYIPELPTPALKELQKRITFSRDPDDIALVGEYLLNNRAASANLVGERCFEEILREAKK